jgi:hypothetical protein
MSREIYAIVDTFAHGEIAKRLQGGRWDMGRTGVYAQASGLTPQVHNSIYMYSISESIARLQGNFWASRENSFVEA